MSLRCLVVEITVADVLTATARSQICVFNIENQQYVVFVCFEAVDIPRC